MTNQVVETRPFGFEKKGEYNMSLTREEAIENHRKMWNWLADQHEQGRMVYKKDYFEEHPEVLFGKEFANKPINNCFLCQYVLDAYDLLCNENCVDFCPLKWSESNCTSEKSEFTKYMEYHYRRDLENLAIIARKIANLPERIGQNEL